MAGEHRPPPVAILSTEPNTTLQSLPPPIVNMSTLSIEFSSDISNATFETSHSLGTRAVSFATFEFQASLDGQAFVSASSLYQLTTLANDSHTLKIWETIERVASVTAVTPKG